MKKVIKLTEKDIKRIVKKTLNEQIDQFSTEDWIDDMWNRIISVVGDYEQVLSTEDIMSTLMLVADSVDPVGDYDGPDVEYGDEEDERRYDDRVNYGIDDESRYDERNYQYGNHPDDDYED